MSETQTKPVDTVAIEIDGVEMEAPKGAMIIEAADTAGIEIPRFCYHRKLSIAANCRMCLVDVEKAPKPLPACATPVMDGMKVYTQSKRALDAQHGIMEFLLINHPLDCPICDQGGECELQDQAMGYGRSVSRFVERKRVVADEDLGSLVATEMTRCIHCTRCVRFLDEIAGTNELGGMGRGETTKIATFIGRSIDSELSGNIIDLCPVGALTNKPFRFRARAWELKSRPTIATHDGLHSNLHAHTRRGEILRTVPRDNESINEAWLSDRDRYSHYGLVAEDRVSTPMVKEDGVWKTVEWPVALAAAGKALSEQSPDNVGWLVSGKASNEELYLAQKLARAMQTPHIDYRLRQLDYSVQQELRWDMPIEHLGQSDAVMLVGCHIRHEVPLLGHKVRQASLQGAEVRSIGAMHHDCHFEQTKDIALKPSAWVPTLESIIEELGQPGSEWASWAAGAERGVLILGHEAMHHAQAGQIRDACGKIAKLAGFGLCEIAGEPNARGAQSVGAWPGRGAGGAARPPGLNARAMLEQPRRAYVLYDLEPSLDSAMGQLAIDAIGQAEAVIYLGPFAGAEVRDLADVILPIAVHPEVDATFVNLEGAAQICAPASKAPGQASAGWKVLRVLANELDAGGFDYTNIDQVRAEIAAEIEVATPAKETAGTPAKTASIEVSDDQLERIASVPIYSADGVVRRSEALQETAHAGRAEIRINPEDARRLQIEDGEIVIVSNRLTRANLRCVVSEQVPTGAAQVPGGVRGTSSFGACDPAISVEKG